MPREDHTSSDRSFDDLARAVAEGSLSRRRALKLFAGTAIAALIPSRALALQQKVTICHKPGTPDAKTIEVSQSAVDRHLDHGDRLGACETPTTTTTETPTTSTTETPTTTTTTTTCSGLPNGAPCTTSGACCSGNCHSSGFCLPPRGTIDVSCNCSEASGTLHTIHLACLSECPQLDTFTSVCTPFCANASRDPLEFVSGGCVSDAPLCACPGCPVFPEGTCICVEDLRNPGVRVCASGIGRIEVSGDCDNCGEAVCIDGGGGAVTCHGPCPAQA